MKQRKALNNAPQSRARGYSGFPDAMDVSMTMTNLTALESSNDALKTMPEETFQINIIKNKLGQETGKILFKLKKAYARMEEVL